MFWKIGRVILVLSLSVFMNLFNLAYAVEKLLPSCATVLTDTVTDNVPSVEKTTFTQDTGTIYLICKSDNVQKGQQIKVVWIAADTNGIAAANYRMDEKILEVPDNASKDNPWNATFSLEKPTAGWALGTYHVDLYEGDKLFKTVKFTIN